MVKSEKGPGESKEAGAQAAHVTPEWGPPGLPVMAPYLWRRQPVLQSSPDLFCQPGGCLRSLRGAVYSHWVPDMRLSLPCSEDCDPWGPEHRQDSIVAQAAGEGVCGGVHPHTGDPRHQHPLELQE